MADNLSMYNRCDYCTYPAVRGVHLPAVKRHRYTWLCDEHSDELDEQRREEKREKREGKVSV